MTIFYVWKFFGNLGPTNDLIIFRSKMTTLQCIIFKNREYTAYVPLKGTRANH